MPKLKVITDFQDGSVYRKKGEVFNVFNQASANHLLRTGQAIEYKEEKAVPKTKEFKIGDTTTKIEELRAAYIAEFGKDPDKRWKESRLEQELEK